MALILVACGCGSPGADADARPGAGDAASGDGAIGDAGGDGDGAAASCAGRATADRPDAVSGYQVQVMYVVPSDGEDLGLDTDGTLARSVATWNQWLGEQSGGPRLRLDRCEDELDITFVRLTRSDADIASYGAFVRDQIEVELILRGIYHPQKIYAVYYGGSSTYACGGGAWPPALPGKVAALYLNGQPAGAPACASNTFAGPGDPPGYWEHAMLHEIFHTLGGVATCAPNHTLQGHVSDSPNDLMYSGDQPWAPSVLDLGRNDYWGHGNPSCLDLSKSAFLDPLPAGAAPPPGW